MATAAQARGSEGRIQQAIWFGPADRPLFGWLHFPAEVSAGVVLCRPSAWNRFRRAGRTEALLRDCHKWPPDAPVRLLRHRRLERRSIRRGQHKRWLSDIGTAIGFVKEGGGISCRADWSSARRNPRRQSRRRQRRRDPRALGPVRNGSWLLAGTANARRRRTDLSPGESRTSAGEVEIPGLVLPGDLARSVGALRLDDALGGGGNAVAPPHAARQAPKREPAKAAVDPDVDLRHSDRPGTVHRGRARSSSFAGTSHGRNRLLAVGEAGG